MSAFARCSVLCAMTVLAFGQTACNMVPQDRLRQSQLRSQQLYQQSKAVASQKSAAEQSLAQLAADREALARQNAQLKSNLEVSNKRLENLSSAQSQLQDRYAIMLRPAKNQPSPLSGEATRRFEELAKKYPDFEFDPQTGVSKFHSDILFGSGSDQVKPSASPLLKEFASIMNSEDAKRLNILVVGHTDDKGIAKSSTKAKHPTNWHLSTDRANAVVLELSTLGLTENRKGAAGYSKYQPVVPNKDESARQRNRRVEIFVLAPDAVVAGWDPGSARN